MEFRIFQDQIIAELNGYNLVESVSLDHDETILIVFYDIRSDVGDIDAGS